MAVKAVIQIVDKVDLRDGEVILKIFMRLADGSADGEVEYGPVIPDLITDLDIVAWAKTCMNDNWNADIRLTDTINIISGTGGLL